MSLMSTLYRTYEMRAGKDLGKEVQLTPVAHINANAHLEVAIDRMGTFLSASVLEKEEGVTLIPVTEASAGRSSGVAPHALCDTLSYIAGDFCDYCTEAKQKKNVSDKFKRYIEALKVWEESEETHPSVQAIYGYLSQKRLMKDLIKAGVVRIAENRALDNKKISGQPYEKVMVRFRVLNAESGEDAVWRDPSLIEAYTCYYLKNQKGVRDVCYLTGIKQTVSENHPKGIVASNYGAKLVSANDSRGYTYRGRFQTAKQSMVLSYEASQKIHSAMTFLVKTQGVSIGIKEKRTFVCWNPEGKKLPDVFAEMGLYDEEDAEWTDLSYRKKIRKVFRGYQEHFEANDKVMMLGLDAATTGRLSVTYYQELMASDFWKRYLDWQETCKWYFLRFDEKKKPYYRVETPIFQRIVECAFGTEQKGFLNVDDRVLKEYVQRLVKCMTEKEQIPTGLLQALTFRASMPLAYSSFNRERVLSTACALIAKNKNDREGEREEMKLNEQNIDRSYLFGRLLAVYEMVECVTYDRGETRIPNAIRMQSVYVNHPLQTWKILEEMMTPYFRKLTPGQREYYKSIISQIVEAFRNEDEKKLNQELEGTYLLGYYLQRAELRTKKNGGKTNEQVAEQS